MNKPEEGNVNWQTIALASLVGLGGGGTVGLFGSDGLKQAAIPAAYAQELKEIRSEISAEREEFTAHSKMTNYRLEQLERAIPDITNAVQTAKAVANETKALQGRMETQLFHMKEIMQGQNQALAQIVSSATSGSSKK